MESKLQILENLGFVREITYDNVKRFMMTEELVDYLISANAAKSGQAGLPSA